MTERPRLMRAISSRDARASLGRVLDEAATGERFIVERAGRPVAAIVPVTDLQLPIPDAVRAVDHRREALAEMVREGRELRRRHGAFDAAAFIRADRDR